MKNYLNNLSKELQELIHIAGDVAVKNNMSVYLVGGFVRDLILGVKNLDVDIVVEGEGIKFAEVLSQKLKLRITRHKRFGTATIILNEHLKLDIASSRREYYPQPAHLPEVTLGTLKDDLMRRDFTINAMAISINQKDLGRFIDFFGGKNDLLHKKIRILHNVSFIDDPTRILRAIRFEQRYNFRLESTTLKSLREAAKLKMLQKVQPHRLRDELILLLKEKRPLEPIRRIQELVGFDFIYPGLSLSKSNLEILKSIEKEINWFKKKHIKRRVLESWLIYFMGLTDSLNINNIKSICKSYAFRNGEEKRILAYKKLNQKFIQQLCQKKIKPFKVFKLFQPLSYEVIILIKAKCRNQNLKKYIEDFLNIYNDMRLHITGDDLHRLGFVPGPHYQRIFRHLLAAKLNGLIKTKEEELELIRKLSKNLTFKA